MLAAVFADCLAPAKCHAIRKAVSCSQIEYSPSIRPISTQTNQSGYTQGHIFGGFVNDSWKVDFCHYFGSGECFLFKVIILRRPTLPM